MTRNELLEIAKSISFNNDMVRAIMDGGKTQTRKPIRLKYPKDFLSMSWDKYVGLICTTTCVGHIDGEDDISKITPKYKSGNILWVKESEDTHKEAARILFRVTNVRVERLQGISEKDCIAEGFEGAQCDCSNSGVWGCEDCYNTGFTEPPQLGFMQAWDSIYAEKVYGWDSNPWVWVYEFEVVDYENKGN